MLHERPSGKRSALTLRPGYVLTFFTLCLAAYYFVVPGTLLVDKRSSRGARDQKSKNTFKLKSIYRHGVGDDYRLHQRLEVTPQLIAELEQYIKKLPLKYRMTKIKNPYGSTVLTMLLPTHLTLGFSCGRCH